MTKMTLTIMTTKTHGNDVFSELFSFQKIWSVTIKLLSLHRKSCISASKIFEA